jgi:haloacetate dehalogenase
LPRGAFATELIMAYGGGNFAKAILTFGAGANPEATATFMDDSAFAVYANFFDQLSVTNTSVFDYAAAATVDYQAQIADQAAGRKINMPTHILFSIYNLETMSGFNVSEVWSRWVAPGVNLTTGGVGDNRGHFIIEEAPDETVAQLNDFMDQLGVSASESDYTCA